MNDNLTIVAKVLVHESDDQALELIKQSCLKNNLVGLKISANANSIGLAAASIDIQNILASNIDLGAIFLTEAADAHDNDGFSLSRQIHQKRPELPILLRRTSNDVLPKGFTEIIAGSYASGDAEQLDALIDQYVRNRQYPTELVQFLQECATEAYQSLIPGVEVHYEFPYLVRDSLIYGELLSLIQLETDWCRGHLMLQTTESEILELIRSGRTSIRSARPTQLEVNSILNEATNMIWGKIRARYGNHESSNLINIGEIPTLVNHARKHISFGSLEPQLCLKHTLHDPQEKFSNIVIYQRVIFNLHWSLEQFLKNEKAVANLVDGGELEMF